MSTLPPADSPTDAPPRRRVVVVLGMHRSGTSAVAGSIQRLGVDFGPLLMPATADNARGFYEHVDLVNLHDRLLLALGRAWDDPVPPPADWLARADAIPAAARCREEARALLQRDFPAAPFWGLKDPRMCLLLPWWESLWAETGSTPVFLIVLRPPQEVAASLARREDFSAAKSYSLWLQHLLAAERATRGFPRAFVDFPAFVADWRAALATAATALGLPWPPAADGDASARAGFVDAALYHPRPATLDDAPLPAWLQTVAAALQSLRTGQGDPAAAHATLDAVQTQFQSAAPLFAASDQQAGDLARQLETTRAQARWYEEEWQKARRRAERLKERVERKTAEGERAKQRCVKKDKLISNLRIEVLSKKRNRLGAWRAILSKFAGLSIVKRASSGERSPE